MSREKCFERENGKLRAKAVVGEYGDELLGMRNGYQWTGQPLNRELAEMMIEVLKEYVDYKKN